MNHVRIFGDVACLEIWHKDELHLCAIDLEDLDKVNDRTWYLSAGYAMASQKKGGRRNVALHSVISGSTLATTDHKNGDEMDNRKSNLRPATRAQNTLNIPKLTGVSFNKEKGRYQAYSKQDGVRKHINYFDDIRDAYMAVIEELEVRDPVSAATKRKVYNAHYPQ